MWRSFSEPQTPLWHIIPSFAALYLILYTESMFHPLFG